MLKMMVTLSIFNGAVNFLVNFFGLLSWWGQKPALFVLKWNSIFVNITKPLLWSTKLCFDFTVKEWLCFWPHHDNKPKKVNQKINCTFENGECHHHFQHVQVSICGNFELWGALYLNHCQNACSAYPSIGQICLSSQTAQKGWPI